MLCETYDVTSSRSFLLDADDPEHREALEACLAQDAECADLCDELLGMPRPEYTRTIKECYLETAPGGYQVHTTYRTTGPCEEDILYPDAAWYPDAAPSPDTLPEHDATPVYDAEPAPADATL